MSIVGNHMFRLQRAPKKNSFGSSSLVGRQNMFVARDILYSRFKLVEGFRSSVRLISKHHTSPLPWWHGPCTRVRQEINYDIFCFQKEGINFCLSSRVVCRIGSTDLTRKGSIIVLNFIVGFFVCFWFEISYFVESMDSFDWTSIIHPATKLNETWDIRTKLGDADVTNITSPDQASISQVRAGSRRWHLPVSRCRKSGTMNIIGEHKPWTEWMTPRAAYSVGLLG